MIAVTGVSGSGKSTLILDTLVKGLTKQLFNPFEDHAPFKEIIGANNIDKIIEVSQDPIGRTPRSNPATYTGVFDDIRDVFSNIIDAKEKGYSKGRFSFNVKGGRCEHCQGDGVIKIDMQFLPSVYITCEECQGKRYNEETLKIKFKGKSIQNHLISMVLPTHPWTSPPPNRINTTINAFSAPGRSQGLSMPGQCQTRSCIPSDLPDLSGNRLSRKPLSKRP